MLHGDDIVHGQITRYSFSCNPDASLPARVLWCDCAKTLNCRHALQETPKKGPSLLARYVYQQDPALAVKAAPAVL